MGNNNEYAESDYQSNSHKLTSVLPITSSIEEEYMRQILSKRPSLLQSLYVCSVKRYDFEDQQRKASISCQSSKRLVVYYDSFDYALADLQINSYNYSESEICWFIYCIVEALIEFRNKKIHHGDISLQNIVKKGNIWQLVDKIFIRNGINAYQRVLEGEEGFVSPHQMQRIRHGFIRESPHIDESDDIFSLGMVALQLGSKKPSNKCYRESFNRFYEKTIEENLRLTERNYSKDLALLIQSMIQFDENDRIGLDGIKRNPIIFNINKFSLKQKPMPTSRIANSSFQPTHLRTSSASKMFNSNSANKTQIRSSFMSPDHAQNTTVYNNSNMRLSQKSTVYSPYYNHRPPQNNQGGPYFQRR